jgi:hypothetical protein
MTIRERFCDEAPNVGLAAVLGEPTVLEVESEGEARTSFEAPPPLDDCVPPPGEAAAAAEDANCETALGAMVLDREDSSWLAGSCCPAGEKADEVDEAADDLRLPTRRDEAVGSDGKLVFAGEYAGRGAPGEGVLRCSCATAVDMGVKRVLWLCLGAPQGCCWLIERACPYEQRVGGRGGAWWRWAVGMSFGWWWSTSFAMRASAEEPRAWRGRWRDTYGAHLACAGRCSTLPPAFTGRSTPSLTPHASTQTAGKQAFSLDMSFHSRVCPPA